MKIFQHKNVSQENFDCNGILYAVCKECDGNHINAVVM